MARLSGKHRATRDAVFEVPTRGDLQWRAIEALLLALGAEVSEGRGSRVRVHLLGVRAVFHRPHPEKEAGKGAVEAVRIFLTRAGAGP
jgi:hypothetical protein